MQFTSISTRLVEPPQDDIDDVLTSAVSELPERAVLAISSKIISIGQGRCVSVGDVADKDELIRQEADEYLEREEVPGEWCMHTITNNLLIGSAGIDESNADGYYILWPREPHQEAARIREWLTAQYGVSNCGVVIVDSHSVPLRRGVVGISLAHAGIRPLTDYRGQDDLFGDEIKMSMANVADSIAAGAVLAMGEGNEQTPLCLVTGLRDEAFHTQEATNRPYSSFVVTKEEDLFYPLLRSAPWKRHE